MLCDKYKEGLIETAARGAALPNSLREHVDICAECRAVLAEQEALFARIDGLLRRSVQREIPASFLLRVKAGLAEDPIAKHPWSRVWVPVAASIALALGGLLVWRGQRSTAEPDETQESASTAVLVRPRVESLTAELPKRPFARNRERHEMQVPQHNGNPRPLLPKNHQAVIAKLVQQVLDGKIGAENLSVGAHEVVIRDLEISPLTIPRMATIASDDLSNGTADVSGQTARE
jgi:hypothetical protein